MVFEERITPKVDTTWRGAAGAVWSAPASWTNGVPGATDTAIFNGTANTNSTMDLPGGQDHIGKLRILNGYDHTITLNNLGGIVVDVFEMDGGTITQRPNSGLGIWINQRSVVSGQIPPATIFGVSTWTRGTISTFNLALRAEQAHPGTLSIGSAGNTVTFNALFMEIEDEFGTVNWTAGSVTVNAGATVTNYGNFFADSPAGTMGNNVPRSWTFNNRRNLTIGQGTFRNNIYEGDGRVFRPVSMGPGQFEIIGSFTQNADGTTTIESGTLLVTGTLTQNGGDVTVDAGAAISVTSDYTQANGTVTDAGSLTVGGQYLVNGGTVSLIAGFIQATGGLPLAYGAELSGTGTITANFSNAGTVDVGGFGATGTLNTSGDYTQMSNGVLNIEILNHSNGNFDVLAVSGLATLDGTLNVSLLPGYQINSGEVYSVLTYSARSGAFAYINYPSFFDPRYDDPPETFSLWVVGNGSKGAAPFHIVHHHR